MLDTAARTNANPPSLLGSAQKNRELPSGTASLWLRLVSILPAHPTTKYSTDEFCSFKCCQRQLQKLQTGWAIVHCDKNQLVSCFTSSFLCMFCYKLEDDRHASLINNLLRWQLSEKQYSFYIGTLANIDTIQVLSK